MTGRDLIIYILENNLEDAPIFKDGKLVYFMTQIEAAIKFNVGMATVQAWYDQGLIEGMVIGKELYIPVYTEKPGERRIV